MVAMKRRGKDAQLGGCCPHGRGRSILERHRRYGSFPDQQLPVSV